MSDKPMLAALRPFEGLLCLLDGYAALIGDLGNSASTIDPRSLDVVASGLRALSRHLEAAHSVAWATAGGDSGQGSRTPCA